MKIIIYILLFFSLTSRAQDCFVDTTVDRVEARREPFVPDHVVIRVHFIGYTNGQFNSIKEGDVNTMLDYLNESYETITFIDGGFTQSNDTSLYELNYNLERDKVNEYNRGGFYMNLHVVGTLKINGFNYAGVAQYPYSGKLFAIIGFNYKFSSTLPHEVGHTFYLYHTHEGYSRESTAETVDSENCDIKGDLVCDTYADHPSMTYFQCNTPYRVITDFNGDTLKGNPKNVMSYSRKECRTEITDGQEYRARLNIAKYFGDGIPTGVNVMSNEKSDLFPIYKVGNVIGNKRR